MDYVISYSAIICTAVLYRGIYALYVVYAKVMLNLCTSFTFRYWNFQYMVQTGAWYANVWGTAKRICLEGSSTFLFYDFEWQWGM